MSGIGCCTECGHITYIDRPAKQWFDHYVSDVWGSPVERGANEGIAAPHPKITRVRDRKLKSAVRLALTLPIDRSLPVCEIGCGGGVSLRQLAANGFSQLVGIEASRHRAAAVRSCGFDVLTTLFEAPEAREALGARGPFALIFAHHALEYTYHLDAVFATAAEVQKPGAYLIVSVPHQQDEPSMGVLMFMPHLHSFTSTSLARLAARFGYEVADASANNTKNLNMVFDAPAVRWPLTSSLKAPPRGPSASSCLRWNWIGYESGGGGSGGREIVIRLGSCTSGLPIFWVAGTGTDSRCTTASPESARCS